MEPGVATMVRIATAAGFELDIGVHRRINGTERERELLDVLELAAKFPARHAPTLNCPPFGPTT